jgi:hypothetical protein
MCGVWCAHFPSVLTTIMDQKVQLLKPLTLPNTEIFQSEDVASGLVNA